MRLDQAINFKKITINQMRMSLLSCSSKIIKQNSAKSKTKSR